MVIPLLSLGAATRIATRLAIMLPDALVDRLRHAGADGGWASFDETLAALVQAPWADPVAIMLSETDVDDAVATHSDAALGAAGVDAPAGDPTRGRG